MAKMVEVRPPQGVGPSDLRQEKAQIEDGMGDIKAGGQSRLLVSQIVQYRGRQAILLVRQVRGSHEITRVRSLIFDDRQSRYQVTVYAHSLSPEALQAADAGWQKLTLGLQRHT